MSTEKEYDVVIIGGGVTGTALLWVLALFTNIRRALIIERQLGVGRVNSSPLNNSHTLHKGGNETNKKLAAAIKIKEGAELLEAFLERYGQGCFMRLNKMVIGVGDQEVAALRSRFEEFRPHFPQMRLIERDEIARLEPKVMEGRDSREPIVALSDGPGVAVNYQMAAETFRAGAAASGKIEMVLDRSVEDIKKVEDGFVIATNRGHIKAKAVAVCAGGASLNFAHQMGYGTHLLPATIAGSFYCTPKVVDGKVYAMQKPGLPVAEVHVDPPVYDPSVSRWGPTALLLPMYERHRYGTVLEFLKSGILRPLYFWALFRIMCRRTFLPFTIRNILLLVPFLGKWVFLKKARKIIPTLRYRDLTLAPGAGGIRTQLIDMRTRTLSDVDKIHGEGVVFTMAPSPGASYCLGNAVEDAETLIRYLGEGYVFDKDRLHADLLGEHGATNAEGAAT